MLLCFHAKAHLTKVLSGFVSHHTKNQGLRVMTNTLIHRWKASMNVLFVFWGCENPCKQLAATDSVEAALYAL